SMSTVQAPVEQRFILPSAPWRTYERFLRAIGDRPGVRLTYDRGTLELRTFSHEHESFSYLLARLVEPSPRSWVWRSKAAGPPPFGGASASASWNPMPAGGLPAKRACAAKPRSISAATRRPTLLSKSTSPIARWTASLFMPAWPCQKSGALK